MANHTQTLSATSFLPALGRTYLALLGVGLPLLALLLSPGLMRTRVAWFDGSAWIGIYGSPVLALLLVAFSVRVSAAVARTPRWQPRTAWRTFRDLRRHRRGRWWRLVAEASGWLVASQLVGLYLAWLMPHIWRDSAGGWVLSYPNYATQAVGIYVVTVFAAAWFGARVRREVLTGAR